VTDLALEVDGLVKRYRTSGGVRTAVDGLSLAARRGTVLAVLGPNGAGKTSTVEVCEGYRTPDGGTVRVLGLPPAAQALRARVGVMPQAGGTYPGLRCGEALRLVASFAARPLDPGLLLERLGLVDVERTACRRLSGGQQQRLSLAMAVVGRPELVFLDEPTAGLDPQARRATWELLEEMRGDGVTVVLTTHYMDEAERLADHVVVLDAGRVLVAGATADLVGDRTGLHPVWIMFALMAGGVLFGFVGVLIAVPVAAVIGVIVRHFMRRYRESDLYRGDKPA